MKAQYQHFQSAGYPIRLRVRCMTPVQQRQRGLAMVEFAIVAAAIFVPLLLGVISVGFRYYGHNTLTKATQVAGRYYAMHCVEQGHQPAYDGALALLNANIQSVRVKDGGNLTSPTVNYVSPRATVEGFSDLGTIENPAPTSCGTQALSCATACNFIKFTTPNPNADAPNDRYVFGTWTDSNPITVTQRILR